MCLYTDSKIPSIAKEDITCYKVYVFYNNQEYVSPYQKAKIPPIDTLTTTELDENNPVNKGFHSFIFISDAKNEAFKLSVMYGGTHTTVFRCIIPKGTKYYTGRFGLIPSYCSESIIIKEPICNFR